MRRSTAATLRRWAPRAGEHVLDVGCGTGALLAAALPSVGEVPAGAVSDERPVRFAGFGIDLTVEMLQVARGRLGPAVPLVAADALALPFRDEAFDSVLSVSALHYWPDPVAGVAECARVLRPGGRLVITDWCADYRTIRALDVVLRVVDRAHRAPLRAAALERAAREAGMTDVRVERYRISWLWGMMTLTGRR